MQKPNDEQMPLGFQDLARAFDEFIDRPFEALWGECWWGQKEFDESKENRRAGIRRALGAAGFDGLVVLRYSPLSNRLLPIRPLILSSSANDAREREFRYFKTWASDRCANLGQVGAGFMWSFVDLYYKELWEKINDLNGCQVGLQGERTGSLADMISGFLCPRGYSALVNRFDPAKWESMGDGKPLGDPIGGVGFSSRLFVAFVCRFIRSSGNTCSACCPDGDLLLSLTLSDEDLKLLQLAWQPLTKLFHAYSRDKRRPWWISDTEWSRYKTDMEWLSDYLDTLSKAPDIESALGITREDLNKEPSKNVCKTIQSIAQVWPCSSEALNWKDRIGVPVVSQGELIGVLALGVPAGTVARLKDAREKKQRDNGVNTYGEPDNAEPCMEDYQNLLKRLERMVEGLLLSTDRIAGDPSIPLTILHSRVSSQVDWIKGKQKDAEDNTSDFDVALATEKWTNAALSHLFRSARCGENNKIYQNVRDALQRESASIFPDDYEEHILRQQYLDHLEYLSRRVSKTELEDQDEQFERWLSSLGFTGRNALPSAWLLGHLWHPEISPKPVTSLVSIFGTQWSAEYWKNVVGVYGLMPEILKNLFFERGDDDARFQPFSMWWLDDLNSRDFSPVAPLLLPIPIFGSSSAGKNDNKAPLPICLKHSLAYGDNTIVLLRSELRIFPWVHNILWKHRKEHQHKSIQFPTFQDLRAAIKALKAQYVPDCPKKWENTRDGLVLRIFVGAIDSNKSASQQLEMRAKHWRMLSEALVELATQDDSTVALLKTVAWQLFRNLGFREGVRRNELNVDSEKSLQRVYLNVKRFMADADASRKPEEPSLSSGSLAFDEIKIPTRVPETAESFAAHLLLNTMMCDVRYLYFFPASTGLRIPHGGISCSFDRPLGDAEFEAFQRATEEVFLPAYEFESARAERKSAELRQKGLIAWSLMHDLKNLLLSASGPLDAIEFASSINDWGTVRAESSVAHSMVNRAKTEVMALWESRGSTRERGVRPLRDVIDGALNTVLEMAQASLTLLVDPFPENDYVSDDYSTGREEINAKNRARDLVRQIEESELRCGDKWEIGRLIVSPLLEEGVADRVVANPNRLEHVVRELVFNAVKNCGDYWATLSLLGREQSDYTVRIICKPVTSTLVRIAVENPAFRPQYLRLSKTLRQQDDKNINGLSLAKRTVESTEGWDFGEVQFDEPINVHDRLPGTLRLELDVSIEGEGRSNG